MFPLSRLSVLFSLSFIGVVSAQDSTNFPVARDTCLWELDGNFNMGTQRDLPSGTLGNPGSNRQSRILFQVDLALPEGATITGARYKVLVTMAPPAGGRADTVFALHRMLTPWVEGTQRGDLPGGKPAIEGESTWEKRIHPDTEWPEPGGEFGSDFAEEPSATSSRITGTGAATFTFNARGLDDLRSMLADPTSNHGWVLITQEEGASKSARRFASREHLTTPPTLEIDHEGGTPPAQPFVATIEHDPTSGEWIISAPATEGLKYVLQCSTSLELNDWKNQVNEPELSDGKVLFRKLMNESREFTRIVESLQ